MKTFLPQRQRVKRVQKRSFLWSLFPPVFGLNTEIYSINL